MSNPQQIFNTVTFKAPRRSLQNLSNTYKGITGFGILQPIGLYEIYPGDVMKKSTQIFMRAMPMIAPILHECDIYVHDFFVPWRLIWDDYEKFLIPQDDETAATIPIKPYFGIKRSDWVAGRFDVGSLGGSFLSYIERTVRIKPLLRTSGSRNTLIKSDSTGTDYRTVTFNKQLGLGFVKHNRHTLSGNA